MSRIFGRRVATAAASASPHSDAQRVVTVSYATDNDRHDRANNRDRGDACR
ncbi:hypothetical protein [Streptomyces sp. NPDC050388]|uniref:hypothetical protein n=1 Tax=Streptomyces sp. NPDC050388 TaxID=3155781 RepID=UPI00343F0F34